MAHKFKELRDKMSPESRKRAHELYKRKLAEIEEQRRKEDVENETLTSDNEKT